MRVMEILRESNGQPQLFGRRGFLTGAGASLRLDAEPVATEFIGTSISTGGDRTLSTVFGGNANNPHLRFSANHHGYVRCSVTRDVYQTDYRAVPSVVQTSDAGVSTIASFVVEKGRAGAQQA